MSRIKVACVAVVVVAVIIGVSSVIIIASQWPEDEPAELSDESVAVHGNRLANGISKLMDFSELDYAIVNLHNVENIQFRTGSGILRFRVLCDERTGEIRLYLYDKRNNENYLQALHIYDGELFVDFVGLTPTATYQVIVVSDELYNNGISVLVCDGYCGLTICGLLT